MAVFIGFQRAAWSHRALRPVLLMGLLLAGACTPSVQGGPDRLLGINEELVVAKKLASPVWYAEYAASTGPRRRELRDQIVLSRIYAMDLYYSEYEVQLTQERQNIGFYSTIASLALTTSATAIAAAETKTVLSAVATGLTGARTAYDKEILIEKTITILQTQMRARRKEVKTQIIARLGEDTTAYPLELALSDLETYYRAGTITGALIEVTEAAGLRLADAKDDEDATAVITRFAPVSDLGLRIRAFARANPQAVSAYLRANHGGMPVARFVISASRADQQRMLGALGIP